jgi:small subunit ribosomal protein S9
MAKQGATAAKAKNSLKVPLSHGVGRRKRAIARVWLRPGSGNIIVNGKDYNEYFDTDLSRLAVKKPFAVYPFGQQYDVTVNVYGGGKPGQADAVKLGLSRAIVKNDESARPALRKEGLLTVDSRVVERKKYGQRGARRKFQFVKR